MKKEIPHVLRVTPAQKGKLPLGMLVVRVVKSLRRGTDGGLAPGK
jgi:hypothetical protein